MDHIQHHRPYTPARRRAHRLRHDIQLEIAVRRLDHIR